MKHRLEGLTFRQIGERMGFSEQRAYRICQDELNRLNAIRAETAEQMQRLEVGRLDELLKAVWSKAKKGEFAAIDRVLSIMQRRAKLLGLDLADKDQSPGGAQVVLHISEVVVNREALSNGKSSEAANGTIDADTAARSPKRLPGK
jgi:hypothetical protein